ncbi:MAG: hypothetical protein H7249_12720 [Chitinophagaceae bacterium]|nr:hypothetical protein [Oligoflexus sp.]
MRAAAMGLGLFFASLLGSCKSVNANSSVKDYYSNSTQVPYGNYRFDEVTWLTTHNSFNNNKDINWSAPNQGQSIETQLKEGVRAFMVDLHPTMDKKDAMLCHILCDKNLPFLKQNLPRFFNTVVKFLNDNPKAIVTIFFEDYATPDQLKRALDSIDGIHDLMFNPYAENVQTKGWPTLQDMVDRNKRLLMLSDHSDKTELGVAFNRDFTAENYWSLGNLGRDYSCKSRWGNVAINQKDEGFERLFVMNHYRNIGNRLLADYDNHHLRSRVEDYCLKASERKPNFVAVDFYDWGDAREYVASLNTIRGIVYKDANYTGESQFLFTGQKLNVDKLRFGNDQISSIRVYPGSHIELYQNKNWNKLLLDATSCIRDLGDANDKISSIWVK